MPGLHWISPQDLSVGPAPANSLQFLAGAEHRIMQESSWLCSWEAPQWRELRDPQRHLRTLPLSINLRLQLFPAPPFSEAPVHYPKGSVSSPDPSCTSSYSSPQTLLLSSPVLTPNTSLLPFCS